MRFTSFFSIILFLASPLCAHAVIPAPWVVYYSDKVPVEAFAPYPLVVLDATYHPPLAPLLGQGKTVLGYISLGEVDRHDPAFHALKKDGAVDAENPNWPGSYYIDIRSERWQKLMLEERIPAILAQGFSGLFLDTLDNPAHLERTHPKKYHGMTIAAANLVHAIRDRYPNIKIMLNRAYELAPKVAPDIDMLLAESMAGDYDFDSKKYTRVPEEDYQAQLETLRAARRANPALMLYSLDYADPNDEKAIAALYAKQRENGLVPYVATVDLHRIVPEP